MISLSRIEFQLLTVVQITIQVRFEKILMRNSKIFKSDKKYYELITIFDVVSP